MKLLRLKDFNLNAINVVDSGKRISTVLSVERSICLENNLLYTKNKTIHTQFTFTCLTK